MADKTKTCVVINPINAKEVFDKKYQASLPKLIKESFEAAINKSAALTTKPSSDKKAPTLSLDGTLTLKKSKKGIEGKLSIVMAKDRSIFGSANSEGAIELDDPDKVSESDVNDLVKAFLKDVQPKVIKELEKKAK